MEACLVVDPEQMAAMVPLFKRALGTFAFKSGHRYSEFVSGDKIATYGLAALVTGGAVAVAAKSGLLRYAWKLIVVGVAAVGGIFKKLFGGREKAR
jgi:uncharacterized membrane-anchored protein